MGGGDEEDDRGGARPAPNGVLEIEQEEAPPPIPPAEMSIDDLARVVDAGDVRGVETALREQNVRMPAVLDQLERVLSLGFGNLAASLVTMLVAAFHVARADRLADRVLEHEATAGTDELVDLAAALLTQERLTAAAKVLDRALAREPDHGRALYLRARILARRGRVGDAFELIARVSPKVLGAGGLAVQAKYALLAGRPKALEGALKLARRDNEPDVLDQIAEIERIRERIARASAALTENMGNDLRAGMAIEYGSLLIERAEDQRDGGRFGMDAITRGDVRRLLDRITRAIRHAGIEIGELLHATEDGEIIAAALHRMTHAPCREWHADLGPSEGAWLCMASAATHPHLPSAAVHSLQAALEEGTLRTLALVLPCGWRGPIVPDVIGRITGDDELPWRIDDEVAETLDSIFDEGEAPTSGLVREDERELLLHVERASAILRFAQPLPRARHVAFLDETPVARG